VNRHRRVLARLDDLVEIADGAVTRRERQRAVMPNRSLRGQQEATGEIRRRHVLVRGDGDQRPAEPPGHVFDEPSLAAASGAFQHNR
jgi:hypothetical protein